MNPRAARLLRATAVTVSAVALASAAHMAAGGAAPGLIGLVTAIVLGSMLGTALLSNGRLTPWRTAATIAGGQLVFHTVFTWGGTAIVPVDPHLHAAVTVASADALHAHGAETMLLAHVVAGLLALVVLLVEQRVVDGLVALTARVLRRLRPFVSTPVRAVRAAAPLDRDAVRPRGRSSLPPPLRRGPPALISFG
ncbi:hypothetical protein [Microcella sp.]|uniref:hypothetical protein n=1 Tax=Microcella sp. TaxID=1913979 RepID=UPI002564874D|nr:hypothetical protein [Microcella sp.]MBX9472914.1 hypothetical protein [Microcella sp.]